jgi:hypothetical protein
MKWPSSSSSTNVSLTSPTSSSVDGGDGGDDDDDDSSPPIPDRFFVHLSFVSPHPPSTPPTTPFAWNELYAPEDLPSLNYQVGDIDLMPYQTQMLLNLLGSPDQLPAYLNEDGTPNMQVIDADRVLYHGLCSYVDKEVGVGHILHLIYKLFSYFKFSNFFSNHNFWLCSPTGACAPLILLVTFTCRWCC